MLSSSPSVPDQSRYRKCRVSTLTRYQTPDTLQQLLGQATETPRNLRVPNGIMQRFAHHCKNIVEVLWKLSCPPGPAPILG